MVEFSNCVMSLEAFFEEVEEINFLIREIGGLKEADSRQVWSQPTAEPNLISHAKLRRAKIVLLIRLSLNPSLPQGREISLLEGSVFRYNL